MDVIFIVQRKCAIQTIHSNNVLVVHLHFSSWKGLLLACDEEMKTASGKWWFHLRSLCHSQTTEGNSHFPIEFLLLEISTNIQK